MTLLKNLAHVHQQIHLAEKKYERLPNSVMLLAVSKKQSIDKIQAAFAAGQHCFGENYLQEAICKISNLKKLPIEWHFIGHLQSNKTKLVAENFHWVHSVDSLKIAERLNQQRSKHLPPLNICLQVNVSQEDTKSGIFFEQLPTLATAISKLENLHLRGLMVIPAAVKNFAEQIEIYQRVTMAQEDLRLSGLKLDTLSMGMSADFEAAIAAGSTIVRIGTAIFGSR